MPVGALSSSNRSQLGYKLEGTYPTNFGVPQGGNGAFLNMTSESLNFDIKTVQSKTIRSDRGVADIVQVGASATGGFQCEMQYQEYDPFILGTLQADTWTMYGTGGVSAAIATLNFTGTTITAGAAPAGNDAFTTLKKGQWFSLRPPAGATDAVKAYCAGRAFRVHSSTPITSTAITVDPATPLNTTILGASMSAGFISSARAANGNVMKSYTLEVQHEDLTPAVYRQYTGMIPSKVDFSIKDGEIITASFDFMGKSGDMFGTSALGTEAASKTWTPPNATKGIFDILEGGASITATTYIKSMDITMDNTLRVQTAAGVFGAAGIGAGTMNVTGKLSVYFTDATMYQKFTKGTASSLSIPFMDPDGNGYILYFPRIKYTTGKVNAGGQDQDNELALDFQAVPDTTAGSDTLGSWVVIYRVGAV